MVIEKINMLDSLELLSFQNQRKAYPVHYHDSYCISIVEKGIFGENELIIPSGRILISHPYELHDNKLIHNIDFSFSTFYISQDVMNSISPYKDTSFPNKVIDNTLIYNELKNLLTFTKSNKQRTDFIKDFHSSFYNTIHRLASKYGNEIPYTPIESSSQIDEVKQYVTSHLSSKIDLTELANISGMNKFKFIRWFKLHVGITPFEYILLKRVGFGKKLIQKGMPLVHVASDSGFYDQSHFSNYFKRYVGMSPNAYKQGCNIFQDI